VEQLHADQAPPSTCGPRLWRTAWAYDVARLRADLATTLTQSSFEDGSFGNAISLPAADDLAPGHADHPNNQALTGVLAATPYFRQVFDEIRAPKTSLRLLRRPANWAYSLHDDRDRGDGIVRLQVPIVGTIGSYLVLPRDPDVVSITELDVAGDGFAGDGEGDLWYDPELLRRAAGDAFELFELWPGHVYYFDVDAVHSLVNGSDEPRVTLSADVLANDWLRAWLRTEVATPVAPVSATPPGVRWRWNALRHGVIRNG